MSAAPAARRAEPEARPPRRADQPGAASCGAVRLARLFLVSRRAPVALAAVAALAAGLRVALFVHWDSYGALQLPLVFETGCATVIAAASAGPFGDQDRAAGTWLPALRLGAVLGLTVAAFAALALAGTGAHLAGGLANVARNLAGSVGLGLVCAAAFGGWLAWVGPAGYLVTAAYALYAAWHGGATHSPWLWPARSPEDVGAWLCAALVFAAGLTIASVRGAKDQAGGVRV